MVKKRPDILSVDAKGFQLFSHVQMIQDLLTKVAEMDQESREFVVGLINNAINSSNLPFELIIKNMELPVDEKESPRPNLQGQF